MTTPNTGIPYVPQGTLDPAAGLNSALNHIDALLQTNVIEMGRDDPPGSPGDGDLYIVGEGSGVWAGHDDALARYVAQGTFWQFFEAGDTVHIVACAGVLYVWEGTIWQVVNPGLRVRIIATDTYELEDEDAFFTLLFTHVDGCEITIPEQAATTFREGFWCAAVQRAANRVTVVGSGDAVVNTSSTFLAATAEQYSPITLERYGEDDWQVNGERQGAP